MKSLRERQELSGSSNRSIKEKISDIGHRLKDGLYSLYVSVYWKFKKDKKSRKSGTINSKKYRDLLFYCLMIALPLLQFCIFYIGVNVNSILLTFKEYDGGVYRWVGFENLERAFRSFYQDSVIITAIKNSLIAYGFSFVFGVVVALLFSFYIYKKFPCHNLFKVMLFLPSILSAVVMVVLYRYFVERAIPAMVEALFHVKIEGLLGNGNLTFGTIIFYNIWIGFGISILMYVGAMNGISESVVEAATLEGVKPLQEFYYITLPLIFPTITTFVVVGVATIFTNQLNLYVFYGPSAEFKLYTLGYYLFMNTQMSTITQYPYLASMGVVMTLIAVPVTLLVKWAMEKFGPKDI